MVGGGNSGAQIMAEVAPVARALWVTTQDPVFLPDDVDGRVLFERAVARMKAGPSETPVGGIGDIVMAPPVRPASTAGGAPLYGTCASFVPATLLTISAVRWVLVPFPDLRHVADSIPRIVGSGLNPTILEYIDFITMSPITNAAGLDLGVAQAVKDAAMSYLLVVIENGAVLTGSSSRSAGSGSTKLPPALLRASPALPAVRWGDSDSSHTASAMEAAEAPDAAAASRASPVEPAVE